MGQVFRFMMMWGILGASLLVMATQGPPHIIGAKLSHPPTIDGVVDPTEWKEATKLSGFIDPNTGESTVDQTEAYLGFDENAIYVAVVAHDSKPDQIVGREIAPGSWFQGEDTVSFSINPFGTRNWEGVSHFTVNVLNTQSEDIAGGRSAKREWRGLWQSAVKRQPDGYSVEMRIPWKVLNYPVGTKLAMDVNISRHQARTQINSMWANTTPMNRPELTGVWQDVYPPAGSTSTRPQFMAYVAPEVDGKIFQMRTGIDARYQVTKTFTALASLAPDFRDIANQVAGVDFTHTERYLDESRPFFMEGSGFFGLSDGNGFGSPFYSRRIGDFDLGTKAYGQITPSLSVGAMEVTGQGRDVASVARAAKSFGVDSNASLYMTTSALDGTRRSETLGGHGWARKGNYSVDGEVSMQKDLGQRPDSAGDVGLLYEIPHMFSVVRYVWVQPDYSPPLAYVPWQDRRGLSAFTYAGREYRTGPLRSMDVAVSLRDYHTYEGPQQEGGVDGSFSVVTRNDIGLNYNRSHVLYDGRLDDINGVGVRFNTSNRFRRYGFYYETGQRSDLPSHYLSADGSFRIAKSFDLGVSQAVQSYQGTDALTIVSLGWEINATRSLTSRIVHRNGNTNAYLAFRNGGGAGAETYLILGDPNADKTARRFSVKVVWAF